MKLNELTEMKRMHLAWRLDHKTVCGLGQASSIARLETDWNDSEVYEIFEWAGLGKRSAKIHAGKVERFEL